MVTTSLPPVMHGTDGHDASYVDWPAIIGGAVFASALSFVLLAFGSGMGLSMTSLEAGEGVSLQWLTIAAGIWFVWVAVSSFGAGGYLAGRMRRRIGDATEDESDTRDGAHGLLVWATGALVGAVMAFAGISGVVGTTAATTAAVAGSAADVLGESGDYYAGMVLRGGTDGAISADARADVATILARSVANGEVTAADRTYLVQLAAAETGTDPAEVEQNVDAALAQVEEARLAAVEAAEQARIAGVVGAFVLAATMLISAAVAYFAAVLGGQHRDQSVPFSRFATRSRP